MGAWEAVVGGARRGRAKSRGGGAGCLEKTKPEWPLALVGHKAEWAERWRANWAGKK
jgi:hypothetical protein